MTQAKVIFNFEGIDVTIQCLTNEKMKDICQRYSNKIAKSINSLIFLYDGNQLNYNINFKEQANVIDRERNIMKVLVYKNENNYIIAEINIKEEDINKDIRILNSYEESLRIDEYLDKNLNLNNENEIKNCEITINNQLIPFNYIHKFKSSGKYIIKYTFKNIINKTSFMFYKCKLLNNIDLSNFNTNNVTDMRRMFEDCSSLNSINLSNFNTNNVTNMSMMFDGCSSLNKIDLSNFNTNNVNDMSGMFRRCKNLKKANVIIKDENSLKRILKKLY